MTTIIFNKQILSSNNPCISPSDRGFTLGHGLFETILIKKCSFPALDYHWKRLVASAPLLGITLPFEYEELESMLTTLVINNNLHHQLASARVTITHGNSDRGILPVNAPKPNFLITISEYTPPDSHPLSALIVKTRKNEHTIAARVKSISYLDNILARQEAIMSGYNEAFLLNTSSNLADGSISNIYMVKDQEIITPPITDGALPGVIRSILFEEFTGQFQIIEKSITPTELLAADEVFLTNALIGVKSVNKVNDQIFRSFTTAQAVREALHNKKSYFK